MKEATTVLCQFYLIYLLRSVEGIDPKKGWSKGEVGVPRRECRCLTRNSIFDCIYLVGGRF